MTKGFISQLERNKSSVSLETLEAVLEVLGERLSTFFSPDATQPFVFGKQDRTALEDLGCDKFELLVPNSTTMAMEPVRMVLGPGQRFGPHASHNGEEFGYVIRGPAVHHAGTEVVDRQSGRLVQLQGAAGTFDQERRTVAGGGAVRVVAAFWPARSRPAIV